MRNLSEILFLCSYEAFTKGAVIKRVTERTFRDVEGDSDMVLFWGEEKVC